MKGSGIKMTAAAVIAAAVLGGCGEAPYELTDSEENIIVNYSAHVVSKYNTVQKKGIKYVKMEQPVEKVPEPEAPAENSTEQQMPSESVAVQDGSGGGASSSEESEGASVVSLNELFGQPGLEVAYTGAYLAPNYIEDSYYSVESEPGKTYVVVTISMTNTGESEIEVDHLAHRPSFAVTVNGETKAKSELTILMEDFATYQGVLSAGAVQEAVLLFQVPDGITELQDLQMTAEVDGTNYQISL